MNAPTAESGHGGLPAQRLPLVGALLVLGSIWIYRDIGAFGFIGLDDDYNIVFNPHLGPLSLAQIEWAFTDWTYMRRYVPLGWLGFSAVFGVFGLNAGGYHIVALLLHSLNTLLLVALFDRLLTRWLGHDSSWWRSLCVAIGVAFWAWHPLRVEFVAWASGLLYLPAMFWLFLALWLHAAAEPNRPWQRGAALLCYTASLLTYPIALGGWVIMVLLDAPVRGWRAAVWRNIDYIIVALAVLGVTVAARIWTTETFHGVAGWQELSLVRRIVQALYVWGHYLWRMCWPFELTPADPVLGYVGIPPLRVLLGAALPIAVTGVLLWFRRVMRWPLYFWAAYLVVVVPFLGVMEKPHYPSDRFSFLAHLVIAAGLAATFAWISIRPSKAIVVFMAGLASLIAITFAALSRQQTEIFRGEAPLWTFLSRRPLPDALDARYALWRARTGDVEGALEHLDARLRRDDEDRVAHALRAEIVRMDRDNRARALALGLAEAPPLAAVLHHNIAAQCRKRGEIEAAAHHLVEVRRLAPEYFARITRGDLPPPAR